MSKEFLLKLASEQDVEDILSIAQRFYGSTAYAPLIPWDEDSASAVAFQVLDSGYCVLAYINEEVVGGIGCIIQPFPMNGAFRVSTELFWYVAPEHRGNPGLALGLIECAEQIARQDGCTLVAMSRLTSSPEGVDAFYRGRGYQPIDHTYVKGI